MNQNLCRRRICGHPAVLGLRSEAHSLLAFGGGLAAVIGAEAGMMAAPMVHLDPDLRSGIQEIKDRTNDSRRVTFEASLHQ